MDASLVVALIVVIIAQVGSLVVVVIAQAVTVWSTRATLKHQSGEAESQRLEARNAEWKNYLIRLMDRLIDARRDYEQFLCTDKTNEEKHGGIVGMAISVCLATNDDKMLTYVDGDKAQGIDGLTPYFVEQGQYGALENWDSRNRKAMQFAVKRLAEMIKFA